MALFTCGKCTVGKHTACVTVMFKLCYVISVIHPTTTGCDFTKCEVQFSYTVYRASLYVVTKGAADRAVHGKISWTCFEQICCLQPS
jgi:hypothetical protein